ncbi:hypothetical protein LX32DRAFT_154280 [Colletotrichum zoysiae]|uniref:Uncharacterized protein n=1 Tax=Colletotrichum zoysiae TaxID=1216348 RepID=A0AAD9HUD8_9PEZI|nr:hypothetical protein LX32DRAFT_154280 [Colletotrichum zoysiae]
MHPALAAKIPMVFLQYLLQPSRRPSLATLSNVFPSVSNVSSAVKCVECVQCSSVPLGGWFHSSPPPAYQPASRAPPSQPTQYVRTYNT